MKKVRNYLRKNKRQSKLFDGIKEDILEICKSFNMKTSKVDIFDLGDAISIEIKGEFNSKLIPAFNEYMSLQGVLSQQHLNVNITYPLNYKEYCDDH